MGLEALDTIDVLSNEMHNGQGQELLTVKKEEASHSPVQIIKELFYGTGKTLYQLFREASPTDKLDI